jgi:ABC-type multidrug transport system fused ATPase/permease subunit
MQTVRDCDYILVLNNGDVVEFGAREELVGSLFIADGSSASLYC